jgi:hypothetical protein
MVTQPKVRRANTSSIEATHEVPIQWTGASENIGKVPCPWPGKNSLTTGTRSIRNCYDCVHFISRTKKAVSCTFGNGKTVKHI